MGAVAQETGVDEVTDDDFKRACNTFGFAPSRALRELLDTVTAQEVSAEREACAQVCDTVAQRMYDQGEGPTGYIAWVTDCAAMIRVRART